MTVFSSQPCRPLVEVLEAVSDPRYARGQRYSIPALLSLCCAGILCGCQTYSAIAQWGRDCDLDLARQLGFSVVTTAGIERRPGASTLFYALRVLDRQELEKHLGKWVEELLACLPPEPGVLEAIAIDGKTLRGTAKALELHPHQLSTHPSPSYRDEVPGVHLLSALSHRLGLTLGQQMVPLRKNEISAVPLLLNSLMLEGRVVTMDALLTQRSIAREIIRKKGTT
jgi:hypothetical protein